MGVTFDEGPMIMPSRRSTAGGGLSGFLVRHRIARTMGQAQALLLLIAVILFAMTFMIVKSTNQASVVDTGKHLVPVTPTLKR